MNLRKLTFRLHRWIGVVVCLQLLAWSLGGTIFSLLDLDEVRGEADATDPRFPLAVDAVALGPAGALGKLREGGEGPASLGAIVLRDRGFGPCYEFLDLSGSPLARVDARTGDLHERIDEATARAIAERDFRPGAKARRCELLAGPARGEFRGLPTPVYRVDLGHAKEPHIYVDAVTGEVLARRNRSWRLFDFFWMLHIMDYDDREDFNHPLLTAFSLLALLSASSGLALFAWRFVPRRHATLHRS